MKPICVLGVALHPQAQAELEKYYEITPDFSRIEEAAAAVVYTAPNDWADKKCPKLRAIGCHSYEDRIGPWAEENGVKITLADSLWRTVAEHTLALLFAAARNVVPADISMRSGEWKDHETLKIRYSGFDLQHKTLGILGLGQIGKELAQMVSGFKMKVLYNDLERNCEYEAAYGIEYAQFYELLEKSDYLCVLVPLNENTRNLVDEKAFAHMKPGCVFINTARAGIVCQAAFLKALERGTIAAAGLDVFWQEAQNQPEELTRNPRVVMAPHLGGSTYECDMSIVGAVINAVC